MVDLSTTYCHLSLKNPLIVSASPLTGSLESVCALEQAGAAALVMPSLFEEAIQADANQLLTYLDRVRQFKSELSIPIIGSLNGITEGGWLEHAEKLEQAGCDALELNIYYVAANINETSDSVERHYIDLVYQLRSKIGIPISVKLSHHFSSLANLVKRLEETGIDGAVLFNRFYVPDIDLDSLEIEPKLALSHPNEALLRIRWIAILREQVRLSLAATGGFHDAESMIKALLVGADAVQFCSVLLKKDITEVTKILKELTDWMAKNDFSSINDMKGKLSYGNAANPSAFERQNYLQLLDAKGR